jgi:hypothetical protein
MGIQMLSGTGLCSVLQLLEGHGAVGIAQQNKALVANSFAAHDGVGVAGVQSIRLVCVAAGAGVVDHFVLQAVADIVKQLIFIGCTNLLRLYTQQALQKTAAQPMSLLLLKRSPINPPTGTPRATVAITRKQGGRRSESGAGAMDSPPKAI